MLYFNLPYKGSNTKMWLVVNVSKNGLKRHHFQLSDTKKGSRKLGIRTRGSSQSGKIVTIDGKPHLLHDPKEVNNPKNRPEFTIPIIFKGTKYSSFLIDKNLVDKLAKYHLSRPNLNTLNPSGAGENPSPGTSKDEKKRNQIWVKALQRKGQARFREQLLQKYSATCLVTENKAAVAIEAAHIKSFLKHGSDTIGNGILLRIDIHRIFDAGLMAIDPKNHSIHFSKIIKSDYKKFDGKPLAYDLDLNDEGTKAIKERWAEFKKSNPS